MSPATRWNLIALVALLLALGSIGFFVFQNRLPEEAAIAAGARVDFNLKTGAVKQAPKKVAEEVKEVAKVEGVKDAEKKEEEKKEEKEGAAKEAEHKKEEGPVEEAKKPEEAVKEAAKEEAKHPEKHAAVPVSRPAGPVVAVVIAGAGLSRTTTEPLLELPPAVSFSFSPYAADLEGWVKKAKVDGRELYLDLPLEPKDYPYSDPGPYALMTGLEEFANRTRLKQVLAKSGEIIGLVAGPDERYTKQSGAVDWLAGELNPHDLSLYYVAQPGNKVLRQREASKVLQPLAVDYVVDDKLTDEAIAATLEEVSALALKTQYAVAMARPYPITLQHLTRWIATLKEKGITLVPLSLAYLPPSAAVPSPSVPAEAKEAKGTKP